MSNQEHRGVLSLFSGAGGLDVGFSLAGWNVAISTDVEQSFLNTIELNVGRYFPSSHRAIAADITGLDPTALGEGPFRVVIGGPPCQSFSAAGRRAGGVQGVADFRGGLFWDYARVIDHFQPDAFVFENVRGLLQANRGRDFAIVRSEFEALGYRLSHRLLDAADYGVPQHRERVIVVGLRSGDEFWFPRPTHGPDSPNLVPHVAAGTALADLDDPSEEVPPFGGKYGELVAEVPPGMNYLYFTSEMGHPEPRFAWRSRFSDFLYKADPDTPTKTIVASQGRYSGPLHWRGRKFTIDEFKRLQSFPDDYRFWGGYPSVVKQIGNSVAPRFAAILAQALMAQMDGEQSDVPLISPEVELSFDRRKSAKAIRTRRRRQQSPSFETPLAFNTRRELSDSWEYRSRREREVAPSGAPAAAVFDIDGGLENGEWRVAVARRGTSPRQTADAKLELSFDVVVGGEFNSIQVCLTTDDLWDIAVAWDVVNECVRRSSSFDHIRPLYGHFTEPYPKFKIALDLGGSLGSHPAAHFLGFAVDFDNLADTHPIAVLGSLLDVPDCEVVRQAKDLRRRGFDVRVYETNKTIPVGMFRLCYPFTAPLDDHSSISWSE